jgi:glycosyltransferase involved in cell wall biosynthesis
MKMSIIIPVYNTENYLSACIDSVLAQTYYNLEVLLINDGSTDSSGDICDSYMMKDPRIKVYHQKNQGVSSARNCGLENMTGELLYFLDSDDEIKSDFLEYAVQLMKQQSAEVLFFTGENEVEQLKIYNREEALALLTAFNIPTSLSLGVYCTKGVKRLRLNTAIHFYEDYEFLMKVLGNSRIVVTTSLNFHIYNQREGSANHMLNINEKVITCLKVADCLKETEMLTNKQLSGIHTIFIQQTIFYFLRSAQFQSDIAQIIQKETKNFFSDIVLSKIKILHKVLVFLFILSPKVTYDFVGPLYRRHLHKRLKH